MIGSSRYNSRNSRNKRGIIMQMNIAFFKVSLHFLPVPYFFFSVSGMAKKKITIS